MSGQSGTADPLERTQAGRRRALKGQLFELVLVGATLSGLVALVILFAYIATDAIRPLTASARWYLLYLGTLVMPVAGFTLYARRRPAVRATNARAFAVVFGCLGVSLVVFVIANALNPYDVLIYLAAGALPAAGITVYGRITDSRHLSGPATPVASLLGLGVAGGLYPVVRPLVGIAATWVAYFFIVTVPVSAGLAWLSSRRDSRRSGMATGGAIIGMTGILAAALIGVGVDPSFWIVLFSGGVVPVTYFVITTIRRAEDGQLGLLGPFLLLGGILVGASLERTLGIEGLEGYLTPTLLLHSWDGLTASNAGVYPQLVGSIVVVGFMAVLAFPLGVGAAVYLEEYAPKSGWGGRLATVLEVNISNLAGVPSVVYGLLGLALFRNTLGFGTGVVVSASGTLALLILPIVVVSAQEAIRSVPDTHRQAAYGMGASRWQTLRSVVLPEAIPGILTGTILALARAIGETAPLVIIAVATTTYTAPSGLFSSATALPLQIFAARSNVDPAFRHGVVPATAVVLLALMLFMNAAAVLIRNRYERER